MRQDGHASTCDSLWNSAEASFSPCVVPFLASLPLAVIVLVAIKYVLGSRHFGRCWPEWTRPFVFEETKLTEEIPRTTWPPRLLRRTVALAALAVVAFGAEIVLLLGSRLPYLGFVLLTPAWAILSVVLAVKRPRTAPTLLLFFYASVLLVEKPVFSAAAKLTVVGYFARNAIVFAASLSIMIVLSMPIRDPFLSKAGISTVVSWMSPLISVGRKRRINEDDVWSLGFEFQHQRLHEKFRQLRGSVLKRLLQANGIDIFIVCTISLVQMVCNFSTPLLLQQLLKVLSDEGSGKRVAMVYATITLIVRLLFAQTQVLNLWYGRRCYERSRGEMIMMVYEKALSRKNTFGQSVTNKAAQDDSSASNGHRMNGHASTERDNKKQRSCQFLPWRKNDKNEEVAKETASMGKIFNLLRGDVYEVAQRFWDITEILDKPIGLIIAVVLVWDLFGPSCLLGVVTVVFAQVINGFITRYLLRWGRTRRIATDTRLQISSQFVESLRHLRWYGWQDHWLRQVMDARDKELRVQIITNLLEVAITFVQVLTSGIFPVVALYGYTILGGHPLSIDVIFPALQLFGMLEERLRAIPSLITVFINASIALGRIEDFMEEPNKDTRVSDREQESTSIRLESCSFAWPGKQSPVLSDVSLTISQGMTVVCGVVGAGKTALLQALLGELDKLRGISHIPNEMVGYCSQTPWLQSMSIRDNILFSSPYNEQRYKRVLEACALVPDLANFAHGDLSFVGENGIGLSGGQKARVALARAVYSSAKILFLDDPLSALDHNTAEFIVRKCLLGSLMQDRTIVLVTHRVSLVQAHADQMLEVADGKVRCIGEQELASVREAFEENMSHTENEETEDDVAAAVPDKFVEEEHRADWGVQTRVYWAYIKAGKLKWWSLLVVVIALYRSVAILQSWFLKEWGEAYSQFMVVLGLPDARKRSNEQWSLGHNPSLINHYNFNSSSWPLDRDHISSPAEDVRPWLGIYLGFAAVQSFFMLLAQLLMLAIVFCAGQTMFKEVMQRVSHATFRFFDVTPVGRLMNRLTSDIGAVDRNISIQFQGIAFQIIVWVSSIVVIASVTPTFLIFAIFLTVGFVLIFMWFLPLSQSLRRLEMVSLSPLLSNFGELLHGLTTVRAFHAEVRFQDRVIQVVDKFQGMDHFYWSLQSWLMYRFEALSSISTFLLTVLALYTNVSAGLVAFVLVAANNFVTSTHGLCRQYGQLQMDFVSVERVDELRHIELEPDGDIDPPAYWPRFGSDVVFEDVTIRYAPHLDPSLIEISIVIPGGSTAAIIGRTGSGKSTLALSLLGVLQPSQGKIFIDGIDISKVNKQALRSRITFVAQDPILFPGSIRKNLDPTDDFSDSECAQALERICARHGWTLDFEIEAGGRNLSQGQRQLIGLTRAALRRSPIVILDEATASIDHETSLEIQRIVREEMRESTVITVAHRLEAINEADFYVVLDRGRIERAGRVNTANE